jgi:hypothetical protein
VVLERRTHKVKVRVTTIDRIIAELQLPRDLMPFIASTEKYFVLWLISARSPSQRVGAGRHKHQQALVDHAEQRFFCSCKHFQLAPQHFGAIDEARKTRFVPISARAIFLESSESSEAGAHSSGGFRNELLEEEICQEGWEQSPFDAQHRGVQRYWHNARIWRKLRAGLGAIKAKATVMASETDLYSKPADIQSDAVQIPGARFRMIPSL